MTNPTSTNRLADAGSPYLRQHADNPVNWQPWDDNALAAATERDVPIFLSIGYSACHWCHVMADESFSDDDVADKLNNSFVPIKVDREERPDLDRIYQTICQLVSGGGGWPLSVWLTPDGKPFYVGTYFPKHSRHNRPGFIQLLEDIAASWSDPEQRQEMESRAEQWTGAIANQLEQTPDVPESVSQDPPGEELLSEAVRAALRGADREHGGFGVDGPKFPQARRLELLLTAATTGSDDALSVVTESLDAMAGGGLYDHVGGGFHRYTVDREWSVPHFEKMLYDNAELSRVFIQAYQYTGIQWYADVVDETLSFVSRELQADTGAFFSTLDAQSEGEEGTFYVWTPEQVHDVVDQETASLICDRFGITDGGNFENKTTVLNINKSIESLAEDHKSDAETVESTLAEGISALFEARSDRVRPARDEKVLASWNGLMIGAYARASSVLDESYEETATQALTAVRESLYNADTNRLHRRVIDGNVAGVGYLDDYTFLAQGAFELYQATGRITPLAFALRLTDAIVSEFYDPDAGTIYFTPQSGEALVARPQEFYDQSTPSSLGVATRLLLQLDGFRTDTTFRDIAGTVLETHTNRITSSPLEHVSLTLAAIEHARGTTELTIAADEIPQPWKETLADRFIPGVIYAPRPPTDESLAPWLYAIGAESVPPIWANRSAVDEQPTVYACQSYTCSPPKTDLSAALGWLTRDEDQ
ncbi:thioredoxin domain-containing protein [Natronocalculus amylovorans]|uniref:Thioredoxin domain-containing protein n=1 Tax=Natronocalculus amylovorans TaxID=2917812 RepID=A0AAE3K8E9_9EURY|nr:thioredoxin domain-containing protein [Natronocalculus amylovorans]MCL9816986.1 thioredoxin domain-containing protein [Natronocalculus amylovorans]